MFNFVILRFGCTNKLITSKLPRHVYLPNSEASVSNDGKISGFRKFLFLSSVFDNK